MSAYARQLSACPSMPPADRDGSGRPCFTARQEDALTSLEQELETLPDFFKEAICEEGDGGAMAEAMRTGDAIGFMQEVGKACAKYREYLVEKAEYDTDEYQRLQHLIEVYS